MSSYIDFFGDNGIFKNTPYTLDDAEKKELEKYWLVTFRDDYSTFTSIVINKLIEHFSGKTQVSNS